MVNKIRVAILFGGCSEEHDVSVKSAREIAAHLDAEKYEPFYIGITKSGEWRLCEGPRAGWEQDATRQVLLSPDKKTHGLIIIENNACRTLRIDVLFPVLHGRSGEDGSVQGLFELSGVPYVGCGIGSSAVCMDKALAYTVAAAAGVATPGFMVLEDGAPTEADAADAFQETLRSLRYPVFVKPARSGSSFGVRKVSGASELDAAIREAKRYDGKVLIEQAVSGCEVGCAVLGNGPDLFVGEVDQIKLSHGIFRIHQEAAPEKGSENAVITVPADLPAEERERLRETAKRLYRVLGCRGLARVDMFLEGDGRIVLGEVNTLPGFTSYSRYPRMMTAAGVTLPELIDRLITLALED
jgi:D-alanine--(R)-lactate ligase